MKTIVKVVISAILLLTMLFSLAACSARNVPSYVKNPLDGGAAIETKLAEDGYNIEIYDGNSAPAGYMVNGGYPSYNFVPYGAQLLSRTVIGFKCKLNGQDFDNWDEFIAALEVANDDKKFEYILITSTYSRDNAVECDDSWVNTAKDAGLKAFHRHYYAEVSDKFFANYTSVSGKTKNYAKFLQLSEEIAKNKWKASAEHQHAKALGLTFPREWDNLGWSSSISTGEVSTAGWSFYNDDYYDLFIQSLLSKGWYIDKTKTGKEESSYDLDSQTAVYWEAEKPTKFESVTVTYINYTDGSKCNKSTVLRRS